MITLLPRVLGALASGLATWLTLVLQRHLNVVVTAAEQDAIMGAVVTLGMGVYAIVHREVSKRINPKDVAKDLPQSS